MSRKHQDRVRAAESAGMAETTCRRSNGARTRQTLAARPLAASLLTLGLAACQSLLPPERLDLDSGTRAATGARGQVRLLKTPAAQAVTLEEAADVLADADVVFLGEQHDSPEGHAVQLALTKALADRRGEIILSMEMFERDAQRRLDLYLDGAIDEEMFLAGARPWPNYAAHYRAAVEFCRERGFHVLAANVYRPIASRVARGGLSRGIGDPWAARDVDTSDGEYRRRFDEVMTGSHPVQQATMDRIFAAQCVKDDTMAESIVRAIESRGDAPPLVVHWNGRFHSDHGLGTVERVQRRRPDLNVAVVSMLTVDDLDRRLQEDELNQGHYLIIAPSPPRAER